MILFFSYNKLGLNELIFSGENKFEIEEIYKFKDLYYNKTTKKYNKKEPIIIYQNNFLGQKYDLLILIPLLKENTYQAYFVQMSINKTIESIEFFINDLKNNESLYKKGIQKFIV